MDDRAKQDLVRVANEWDRAMVENDAEAIGRYMADEWIIIGSDGSVGDKPTFLQLIKSGMAIPPLNATSAGDGARGRSRCRR
jgi:hypothetical protein